ncbi:MAG: hypothetical protein RLZ55_118, partial [Actinomycetota bacterium]
MSLSDVVDFPAVDATAEIKAAWIAAGGAGDDWWPGESVEVGPWPGDVAYDEGDEGALLSALGVAAGAGGSDPVWVDPDPGAPPAGLAAWVRPEWWSAPVRAGVRALMRLAPGPELVAGLAGVGRVPVCPADHRHWDPAAEAADITPAPGSQAGFPCACQLVVAAGWQAVVGWAEVCAAGAVVDVCGPAPVVVTPGMARARVADPARVELAAVLRLSPDSTWGPLRAARDLEALPALAALCADATVSPGARRAVMGETAELPADARARVVDHV